MKKFINAAVIIIGILTSIPALSQDEYYGKKIDDKNAISMEELAANMKGKESMDVKVTGKVADVCQAMGCWMTLEKTDGTVMRVRMKGHDFFVPKNIAGKTAVIEGTAQVETTSVEELQHYAEDAGKSKAEVDEIKESKTELTFEAEGVILK